MSATFTDDLTPPQRAAAEHIHGPLLILAGPGSGKTRVVTRRIANMLAHGISQRQILAITFTNKAAGEMAERVQSLVPGTKVWISTFHRFCARLLRQYGEAVGLQSNFSILDTGDQKQGIRRVLSDLDFDPLHYSPDKVLWRISTAKNDLLTPERYQERFDSSVGDHWQAVVRRVYPAYQKWLLESNAVDFDDLLLHTANLLAENPELRETLGDRYRYILVDEYQDTNIAQYQIVAAMAQRHRNLCVTGDPDQSIYGWRGARIENILRFERDFPETKTIRLEQNFRSTQAILESADALIVNNTQRKHKSLLTDNTAGEPVQLLRFEDSQHEAEGISKQIRQLLAEDGLNWSDVAIFYRVNSLSRQLETTLMRQRIPFQVAAGVAFYDRVEIRDLLAYLRLIDNPADQAAFLRIVNKPLRGLGKTSQDRLVAWAGQQGVTLLEAAARADKISKLSKKAVLGFKAFAGMLERFSLASSGSVADLLTHVVDKTRYTAAWQGIENEQAYEHLANVDELVNAARQYDEIAGSEVSLQGFLEQTALVSDTDKIQDDAGRVTLMTLHAAKGLEFPAVFVIGVEDGLIPHERSKRDGNRKEVEEERRLLFVGMTRAKQRLFLTETRVRSLHGKTMPTIASPFLTELICEKVDCGTFGGDTLAAWSRVMQGVPFDEDSQEEPDDEPQIIESSSPPASAQPVAPALTTGAALLTGAGATAPRLPLGFAMGQQVRHPRYGRGTVIEIGGFGPRRTVTVAFADSDRKETFVVSKAPLQPVGN
ncbi:ATP-dependent helicase [Planctomicrobium piriforme]|uniref:DNA 3'-5' helicase n=1 Tax=Planctomicrobium piriforme TaxID=1576369 RepID=A0A1I3PZA3_9PLAN|nr:UvrD-helicase domain-containing protein [Planctomicrobium piriforme]SFJ26216.1 DNA helicase-2 / ATP-dependent DNA helicase PcrA [Planctomicrobium piriforme]